MPIITPSITAPDANAYRQQMATVAPFASRIHIDFSDGEFAPIKLVNVIQAYWPESLQADLHLMYKNPTAQLETVVSLKPQMVIVHAEAEDDVLGMILQLRALGIKAGVALLQQTAPHTAQRLIAQADHVLIFSGTLGKYGGAADLTLLKKVAEIRAINPIAEIGWDGGVTPDNIAQLVFGGVEVAVSGGAIQNAPDPAAAYTQLMELAEKTS
jgi:ribulose-phosphate 3-epimerase